MKILYFASIREALDIDEETFSDIDDSTTIDDVVSALRKRGEPWFSVLSDASLLTALNQELVPGSSIVSEDDELALMPPVTGG